MGHELSGNSFHIGYPHDKSQGIHSRRQSLPMDSILMGHFMTGYNCKRGGHSPLGHRNSRISGHRYSRGYTRNKLKGNACLA